MMPLTIPTGPPRHPCAVCSNPRNAPVSMMIDGRSIPVCAECKVTYSRRGPRPNPCKECGGARKAWHSPLCEPCHAKATALVDCSFCGSPREFVLSDTRDRLCTDCFLESAADSRIRAQPRPRTRHVNLPLLLEGDQFVWRGDLVTVCKATKPGIARAQVTVRTSTRIYARTMAIRDLIKCERVNPTTQNEERAAEC